MSFPSQKGVVLYNSRYLSGGTDYRKFLEEMISDIWEKRRREQQVLIFPKHKTQQEDEVVQYIDKYSITYNCYNVFHQALELQRKILSIPSYDFGGYFRVQLSPFNQKPILEYKAAGNNNVFLLIDVQKL